MVSLVAHFIMSLYDRFPAYGGRGPSDLRLGLTLGIIATIFMILRVYVRLRLNKFGTTALLLSLLAWVCSFFCLEKVKWTDSAKLLTTMTQTFGILSVLHGLGNHITVIEEVDELHNFLLFTWITVFFFNLAIPTGKVAVCAFLIEMNGPSSKLLISIAPHNGINQYLSSFFRPKDSPQPHCRWCAECYHQHPTNHDGLVSVQSR